MNKFIALPQEERDRFDLIMGHVPYGLHRFLSRPCVYVIVLRNPLARFCSIYRQLLRHSPRSRELAARNYSIEDFLQEKGYPWWLAQRFFADMIFTPCEDGAIKWAGWHGESDMLKDTQALKNRLRNSFMLVGLSERLDDFAFMLCRMMGWSPGVLGHENRHSRRLLDEQMLSPEQVDRANKILSTEWELYRHAEEIFQRKWKELSTRERIYANCWRQASKTIRSFLAMRGRMLRFLRDAPLPCRPLFRAVYLFTRKYVR